MQDQQTHDIAEKNGNANSRQQVSETHKEFLQIDKKKDKTYNIKMDRRYEYTMYQKQIQMTNTLGIKEIH